MRYVYHRLDETLKSKVQGYEKLPVERSHYNFIRNIWSLVDNCQYDLQINQRTLKYECTIIYLRNVEKID